MTRAPASALAVLLALTFVACPARTPSGGPPSDRVRAPPPEAGAEPTAPPTAGPDTALRPGQPSAVTAEPRPPRVCAGGDLLLGNNLDTLWAARAAARLGRHVPPFPDPDSLLAPLRPLLGDASVVLVNVEGAIGEGAAQSKCRPGSTRCYAFRQPIPTAAALARFARPAAVVGNVANNHALDAGPEGLARTIRNLERASVQVTGWDTLPTLVVTPLGDTVAVLGFSTFRAGPDAHDLAAVRRHVARAFARYHRVVVTVHMGAEGRDAQRTPRTSERFLGEDRGQPVAFAHAAAESGAGLVIGHGPHVLRAAEWHGDALIFYSLGNLLTYGPFNLAEPLNRGAIACASLDRAGRVRDPVLEPTYQEPPGRVGPDPSGRATWLVDSLSRLDFPETGARVGPGGAVERPGAGRQVDSAKKSGGS